MEAPTTHHSDTPTTHFSYGQRDSARLREGSERRADSISDLHQCCRRRGGWGDGGKVSAAHHSFERRWDWVGAVSGHQRRHELEASRDWGERHLIMDGLLPIIRRVRRPLVPVDGTTGGADAKPALVPVKVLPEPAAPVKSDEQKETLEKIASSESAK